MKNIDLPIFETTTEMKEIEAESQAFGSLARLYKIKSENGTPGADAVGEAILNLIDSSPRLKRVFGLS